MKYFYACAVVFILAAPLFSQTEEYYFRFKIQNMSEVDQLTRQISIDKIVDHYVYAYANDQQWIDINSTNYEIERLPHPGSLIKPKIATSLREIQDWDSYPSYPLYLTMMQQYTDSFPQICLLDTIGYTVNGRLLLAVKISDHINNEEDEPEFFYTSSMHGDEVVGYVLMLRLIDYLLHQYGQGTPEGLRVTHLIDNMEIWINPLANPDGTYRADTTITNPWRENANGVDLNRDFPDRINDPINTPFGREPETQAMMAFAAAHNFNLSANFHGGSQVANYPWDNGAPSGSYSACPDDAWFIDVATKYASTNNDLLTGGFTNGITNGCAWYSIFGGRQDWIYYWYGGRELTIELWDTKFPSGSVLPQRWINNKESFLSYIEQTFKGIRGLVTDAETGNPISAQIDVQGYAEVPVFTDPDIGDFHRMLLPGMYNVYIRSLYHQADTLFNISVLDTGATQVNVVLQKLPHNGIAGQVILTDTNYFGGIEVQSQGKVAFTNSSGYFELDEIYAGQLQIQFSKPGYIQTTIDTSFDALSPLWVDAELRPSEYSVLLIDDDGGKRQGISKNSRQAQKADSPIEHVYQRSQSANIIEDALNNADYEVTRENSSQTDPVTWQNYSLLCWSSGAETSPISNPSMQNGLINFGQSGKPLIIEGGEIGYEFRGSSSTTFRNAVLHFSTWQTDNAGNLIIQTPTHPIAQGLPSTIPLSYSGYGDQDALTLASGSQLILHNSNPSNTAGLLINSQHLFYAFNLAAINQSDAAQLVSNSAAYFLPLSPDSHDVAIYQINGINNGEMVQAGNQVSLSATIRNYGKSIEPPGIPIDLFITDDQGNILLSSQTNTADSLLAGNEVQLILSNWVVPDTTANLRVTVTAQLINDNRTGNNTKTSQITSLSTSIVFSEDFESVQDTMLWRIATTDSQAGSEHWHATYLPAMGRYSMRVNPNPLSGNREEWLISPELFGPTKLFFYWDYGADQIQDTLLLLASTSDDSLHSFTDTLLIIDNNFADSVNHFDNLNTMTLNQGISYLAFVYKGAGQYYWAVDNIALASIVTDIADNSKKEIPASFSLMQNYPNPFNPTTTIQYSLPTADEITIIIYNILGEKVRVLVNEPQKAGIHQALWDGKDEFGEAAASGIYLYRIQTSGVTFTKKMLLVK